MAAAHSGRSASEPNGKMRILYSRDFLLSFGELEHCKKLPSGFDTALLSELQELSAGVLERNKGYYQTPLGRSDGLGSYTYSSRGGNSGGRWDTRSTGSSDRDGELPDRESLTQDKRNTNQYRRNWQNTEHDGLLGSGGFPRPSGYAGQLASKDHGTPYQTNRTSQRYQPPRPYKAASILQKDIDSVNDETFGSSEYSSEDRAEEERKRRASFELMRKEQHKAMQGKKTGNDMLNENPSDDIISQLQTPTEKANTKTKNEKLDGSSAFSIYHETAAKTSSVLPPPAARPLVPPGFANAFVEKKLQSQSSNISLEPKGHNATVETNTATIARTGHQLEGNKSATGITECESKEKDVSDNIANLGQKHSLLSGGVTPSTEFVSGVLKGSGDWEGDVLDKYSIEKEGKSKSIHPVGKDSSLLMLEHLLGSTLPKHGSNISTDVENPPLKTGDSVVSSVLESSKFAPWFIDEDLKPAKDLSSKSLFSMIVKNENSEQENIVSAPLSDGGIQNLSPRSPIGKFDSGSELPSFTSPTPVDTILKQQNHSDVLETVPVMMTCEDLEQAMLEQVKSSSCPSQKNAILEHPPVVNEPVAMQKAADNHASHHLLSLLQKGTDSKGPSSLGFQLRSEEPRSVDINSVANDAISGSGPADNAENTPTSGKNLTMEALFGAAFMSELHSKDGPVSIRGSATGGLSEFAEAGKTLPSGHEVFYPVDPALINVNNTRDVDALKAPGIEYRSSTITGPSQGNSSFEMRGMEIQLPEEDNLFTLNDSLPAQNSDILPSMRSSRVDGLLPERVADDLSYRLQSLAPGDSEHIKVLGPDAHSHEQRYQAESQNLYHLLQGRPPMMAHHPMMDHVVNRNQQAPFDVPQPTRHDHHRSYPANVNPMQHPLPGPGVPMDPAAHRLMLQYIMPGSFPPEGLPRGVPPSQPVHHVPGYRPEMSNVNNFHMHPRQPNYGEFGLMPGPEMRGNHPGAIERLMQMEMSARSKQQVHPAMAGPVPGGMYGHELDMNLRYR